MSAQRFFWEVWWRYVAHGAALGAVGGAFYGLLLLPLHSLLFLGGALLVDSVIFGAGLGLFSGLTLGALWGATLGAAQGAVFAAMTVARNGALAPAYRHWGTVYGVVATIVCFVAVQVLLANSTSMLVWFLLLPGGAASAPMAAFDIALAWLLLAAAFGFTGYRLADFALRVQDDPQAARI
ncbi:MAG TPA: hypothetical protein VFR15_09550 [Chloroflexia bacterium]|nr:hypothetical protein [Chloroflexia bacterium]